MVEVVRTSIFFFSDNFSIFYHISYILLIMPSKNRSIAIFILKKRSQFQFQIKALYDTPLLSNQDEHTNQIYKSSRSTGLDLERMIGLEKSLYR